MKLFSKTKLYSFLFASVMALVVGCGVVDNITSSSDTIAIMNGGRHENVLIFPEPTSLITLDIQTDGQELPTSKDQGALDVILRLTIDGVFAQSYGTIQVQGSSTARWPKKNWSFKFYEDSERSKLLKIKIGSSVATEKWMIKSEWIDPSMIRNALAFRLWDEMIKSREGFPKYEVDYSWYGQEEANETIRGGIGFPIPQASQVIIDGKHYGMGILLMGHENLNHNIDVNNPKHVYMEFDARGGDTSIFGWEKFRAEGVGEWIEGYHPKSNNFSSEILDSINELDLLFNGTLEYFKNNMENHLDKRNLIDYMLFAEMIYDYDARTQDLEFVTYDLVKWYIQPWDKDTTFGMWWEGTNVLENSASTKLFNYVSEEKINKPFFKTYKAFQSDVEERYAVLREKKVFATETIYDLITTFLKAFPNEIWAAEKERWDSEGRQSLQGKGAEQIIDWFEIRLGVLDNQFKYSR